MVKGRLFKVLFLVLTSCSTIAPHPVEAQKKNTKNIPSQLKIQKGLSDEQLLDLVQKQTFRYFWNFGHPVSGMARERSNVAFGYGDEVVTTGGTGFGIMATIVATDRKWINRDSASAYLLKMVKFLAKADAYHGVFPHWLNGTTGKTIPFSRKDDGADLVESSFLFQGLLTAKQYFNADNPVESELRNRITWLWDEVEWDWFTKGGEEVLYWHWSPNNGWAMNFPLRGYNECLITYVLAASATRYPVSAAVYHRGWAQSNFFLNGKEFYGHKLPLGFDNGGPLFFSHYSFLGLDPRGLKDRYADYWEQNKNHTLVNRAYCLANPKQYKGYGTNSWGLTASDSWQGYAAHSPNEDLGVITPTAALSAFPYTPEYSMQALRHFYEDLGGKIWSEYGFVDAFSEQHNWYAKSHLAIDQGPIIVMIENYRSGLLWKLFMSSPEIQKGLNKLGFTSPALAPQ
ncbi:glucoamylase family protein [Pedobacter hiemivivus]|uniref:Beta-glucosidase n=1 Tax=Pedobacter hiemivivus TaxID=2530454 RepID=A0A4R0MNG9_9SPHI|nr:glucoamylase family protein [Pedobacter hiemivivus]TCC88310.1 beta-glucosidase [Pedobacter hiemivivus]